MREARPEVGIAGWEAVAELRDLRDALRLLAAAVTGDDRPAAGAPDHTWPVATQAGNQRPTAGAPDHTRPVASRAGDHRAAGADDRLDGVAATATGAAGRAEVTTGAAGRAGATTGAAGRAGAGSAADLQAAIGVVNRACASAPSWSELHWSPDDGPSGPERKDAGATATATAQEAGAAPVGGPRRVVRTAHAPALAAVAAIAEEAVALFAGPDRLLLRACHAPGCVLYFVRNHPRREWCSDGCGNRARVARHYQRHHGSGKEGD
ncbi:CGNR zinc finger domain-containing protein [Dactylosporangium cerinum]